MIERADVGHERSFFLVIGGEGVSMMAQGTVKWFNDKKGYGFIIGEAGKDVFVHHTVIQGDGFRTLKEGETVTYEASNGPKGEQATKVLRG